VDSASVEADVRAVRSRRTRRRVAVWVAAAAIVLLLAGAWWQFPPSPGKPPESAAEPAVEPEPEPTPAEVFAARFANEDFAVYRAYETPRHAAYGDTTAVVIRWTLENPDADSYEFAKRVILADWDSIFPDARHLSFGVLDMRRREGQQTLLVMPVTREELDGLRRLGEYDDGVTLVSRVKDISRDRIGDALRLKESREGKK
jgi:hypothetical protein